MPLSPLEQSFCLAYIRQPGHDPAEAYRQAGYKAANQNVAAAGGARLLRRAHVQAEIERLRSRQSLRAEFGAAETLRELKRVALSDVRKLFRDDGTMKPPNEWDDDTAAAIASVDVEEIWDGRGEGRKQIGVTKRVKLWSKSDALRMAMELFGISQKPTLETILLLLPVDVATLLRAAIASCPAPGVPPVRDLPGGVAGDPGDGPLDRPAQAIPQ